MDKFLIQATVISVALCLTTICARRAENSQKLLPISKDDVEASLVFDRHCDTCHGKDGQAKTFKAKFNHARNLADAQWQSETTDERIFNSIFNGRGKMPAFGKKLSEEEVNALVEYVRTLKK